MKPARGPQTMFFGNDCWDHSSANSNGGWEEFIVTDVPRGTAVTECFWSADLGRPGSANYERPSKVC